jgi:RimJ/RimL family protein N-acetyltransferase
VAKSTASFAYELPSRAMPERLDVSTVPVLHRPNVTLRRAVSEDVQARLALGRDPGIFEMFGVSRDAIKPMTREDAEAWVQRLIEHTYAWVIERGALIGEARLDRSEHAAPSRVLCCRHSGSRLLGQGLGTEVARLVLGYAFQQLKLHRVSLRMLACKDRAIRSYRKCGFVLEGREREAAHVNGRWHDDLRMGLLEQEFVPAGARLPATTRDPASCLASPMRRSGEKRHDRPA